MDLATEKIKVFDLQDSEYCVCNLKAGSFVFATLHFFIAGSFVCESIASLRLQQVGGGKPWEGMV